MPVRTYSRHEEAEAHRPNNCTSSNAQPRSQRAVAPPRLRLCVVHGSAPRPTSCMARGSHRRMRP
eukprot:10397629-Lingulodinium_polyedra.AAC.1